MLTLFANFASTAPMSFRWFLRKSCLPGLSFASLPSLRRAGWAWRGSGCLYVASQGFSSPPARLRSSGRGGGASGCAFGERELTSVSSVPSWTGDSGVALWRRTPATCYVPVGSPSSTLYARRGVGEGEFFGGVFSLFSVASPASSLHAQRGGGAGGSTECRSS